jgi:predicted small lipoprotein YifL
MQKRFIAVLCAALLTFSFTACKKEGPIERAGKKIDRSIKKAGEKIKETGQK